MDTKLVRTKWIDTNKGDQAHPDYRSRLVAMEFNDGQDPSLFAATPPLEAMRFLVHLAATKRKGENHCLMTIDVKRAYFNAQATSDVFISIPKEDQQPGDEHRVGKLRRCLYGTRDADFNWGETVAAQLRSCGYIRGVAIPSVYHNPEDVVACMVHGDDYLCVGPNDALDKLKMNISKAFEIKHTRIGHREGMEKEGRFLNRIIRATPSGWEVEADQRHGELIAKELGVDMTKGLTTPGVDEPVDEADMELHDWRLEKYRSLAARANYLALDRPDLQFAVKELCRNMSRPTESSWRRLVRVGKYFVRSPRLIMQYDWQADTEELTVHSDANWAGCVHSRKSTSGGVIMLGPIPLKHGQQPKPLLHYPPERLNITALSKANHVQLESETCLLICLFPAILGSRLMQVPRKELRTREVPERLGTFRSANYGCRTKSNAERWRL